MQDLRFAALAIVLVSAGCEGGTAAPASSSVASSAPAASAPKPSSSTSPPSAASGASAASSAPASSTDPAASSAPAASASAAAPTTSPFAGAPDPGVKLLRAQSADMANLWIQAPFGWSLITDPTLGWQLTSTDHKAQLLLEEVDAKSELRLPTDGLAIGYELADTKMAPAQPATFGAFALPGEASSGTARISKQKEAGKVQAFIIHTGARKDVRGVVLIRAGASAEQEAGLLASIRSLRRATDK